jgi:hypothetical protein
MSPEAKKIYQTIIQCVAELDRDGILQELHGNCVLASDIIQSMLHDRGVASRIVECQLTISYTQKDGSKSVKFIGYDYTDADDKINTHAVVITQSDPPMIVDASIGHNLGDRKLVTITLCEKDQSDPAILGTCIVNDITLVYRNKKIIKLVSYHQKDILERMRHEYDTIKNIKILRYLVMGTVILSATNFFLNITLLLIKFTERQ